MRLDALAPGIYSVGDELHLDVIEIARDTGIPIEVIENMLTDPAFITKLLEKSGIEPGGVTLEVRNDAERWRH